MKRIAVFCGSSSGSESAYSTAADELGALMVKSGIGLVYGGGGLGLMGRVAKAVLGNGGEVIGVIPKFLMEKELGNIQVPDLRIVETMHERKALMAELSDGFIAMPGGFGTLEEFTETLTWAELGLHRKPFGLLNVAGFYDHFLAFIENAVNRQFIKPKYRALLLEAREAGELLEKMNHWRAQLTVKLMTPERI